MARGAPLQQTPDLVLDDCPGGYPTVVLTVALSSRLGAEAVLATRDTHPDRPFS
ncbi:MAG TPA: hypothetical protein VK997_01285 [Deferrisomatales bacterium]|nr:hypothetical protein [Deferrisomatales bacterium]